jgi:hypothetical protein
MMTFLLFGLFSVSNDLSKDNNVFGSHQTASYSTTYENVTTHEGDLIIDGYKTVAIENCTFYVTRSIYVQNYGKLNIKNSRLVMEPHYKDDVEVSVSDFATLEVENSTLTFASYLGGIPPNIHVRSSQARLHMRNTMCQLRVWGLDGRLQMERSWLDSLYWWSSDVELIDSTVDGETTLQYGDGKQGDSFLQGLRPNQVQNVSFECGGKRFQIRNSKVGEWSIDIWSDYHDELVIRDSEIFTIWPNFKDNMEIVGIKPGFYEHWNVFEHVKGHTTWNLTLINTQVDLRWKVILEENVASIRDSILQLNVFNTKRIIVENCHVEILDARGSEYLKFTNCTIVGPHFDGLPYWTGKFIVEFENSIVTVKEGDLPFEIACINCFFRGEVKFVDMSITRVNFQKGTLVREYPTVIKDAYANPVANATVILKSKNGTSVWNGMTDVVGRAYFNVTFNNTNYMENWILTVVSNRWNASREIGFLTNTPVEIMLDNMPPSLEITEPVNGSIVYGTEKIKAIVSDNIQLHRMQLLVDGSLLEEINLTYTSYTYVTELNTRKWANGTHNITVTAYDKSGNMNSTSVIINVQNLLADLNGDGVINIIDVAIVARAFQTSPGDAKWNSDADLNKDGIINIVDVATVAREFGKTT